MRRNAGLSSYLMVAALAAPAGAAGAWLLRTAPSEARPQQVTTHGEWVQKIMAFFGTELGR
jgi:hypothetical protein